MKTKLLEKKVFRDYAVDLLKQTDIENVIEFVKDHVGKSPRIYFDYEKDKVAVESELYEELEFFDVLGDPYEAE